MIKVKAEAEAEAEASSGKTEVEIELRGSSLAHAEINAILEASSIVRSIYNTFKENSHNDLAGIFMKAIMSGRK